MSYNANFNEESNVAYHDTFSDLNFSTGYDFPLFPDMPSAPLPSVRSSDPITVCMPQVELGYVPSSVPSSGNLPDLEYSPLNDPFSRVNSTKPSPLFQVMGVDQDFTPLHEALRAFNNSGDDQSDVPLFQAPKQPVMQHTGATLMARQESSSSLPPSTPRSSVLDAVPSGVRKNKRAAKPLAEINPDLIHDPTAKKRAKNTSAARKSRQKKLEREEELVRQVEELKKQNEELLRVNEQLRAALNSPALF
jgi:hypothetical protein